MKRQSKYTRCPKCRELVVSLDPCANCEAQNPLSLTKRMDRAYYKRPTITLDMQERNSEEADGGVLFPVKDFRA